MIDLNAEKYSEITFLELNIREIYSVPPWTHCLIRFTSETMPDDISDPEILVILDEQKNILQIVLFEDGCDSPNFQLTGNEKEQITKWIKEQERKAPSLFFDK